MLTENNQILNHPLVTRLLIAAGAIGPLLFISVFLVEGVIRPGYSAWHNFVSDLSLSNQGWIQWRGWALPSRITGIICVGSFIACLAVAVLDEKGILPGSPAGLLERIAIITGWVWIALLAIRLLQVRLSVSSARSAEGV